MVLFGKKKKEIEEEGLEKFSSKKLPQNKKFRDLYPESKRKRKEPPKPWGKKERWLVFLVLAVTAGTSALLSLSARGWKLPGLPKLSKPSLENIPFGEQTIVIEGNKTKQKSANEVVDDFKKTTTNLSGVYGFYVVDLDDGFSYGSNENDTFQAASLIKLPVMVAAFSESEKGNLDLDANYILKDSDKLSGSGSIVGKPAGTVFTYRELLEYMGKQSDNTAFNVVRKKLGDKLITDYIIQIGMSDTSLEANTTSPYDIGLYFKRLYNGQLLNDVDKTELLDNITDTIYEKWLAAGVPEGIKVAHKFGLETNVVNDAGVVFTKHPFVLVLMSHGVVISEANDIFPSLAGLIYSAETEN
jgi:beta-lactamase class A